MKCAEAATGGVLLKKVFLKILQNRKIFLNKVVGSPQVFSCEFCEIFKNNYFVEHLQMAASKSEINPEKSLHWYGI